MADMNRDGDLFDCVQRVFPSLARADPELRQRLRQQATRVRLGSGSTIAEQGGACTQLALLLEGSVRVFKLGESGRELTLYRIEAGQSCVLTTSCIMSQRPFPAIAVAETDIDAIVIPAGQLRLWVGSSAAWRDFVFGLFSQRLGEVISVVEEVAFHRMDERVAACLLQWPLQADDRLDITHQAIAAELGSAREVVSRILKDLEAEGLIGLGRGHIAIRDERGLKRRAGGGPG